MRGRGKPPPGPAFTSAISTGKGKPSRPRQSPPAPPSRPPPLSAKTLDRVLPLIIVPPWGILTKLLGSRGRAGRCISSSWDDRRSDRVSLHPVISRGWRSFARTNEHKRHARKGGKNIIFQRWRVSAEILLHNQQETILWTSSGSGERHNNTHGVMAKTRRRQE